MKARELTLASLAIAALMMVPITLGGCGKSERREPAEEESAERESPSEEGETLPERVELDAEAYEALGLGFATVERRPLAPVIEVPAELAAAPDRQATIGPRVAGRVVRVLVNVGDRVGAGSPLLVLESTEVGEARADFFADQARAEVARRAAERARELLASRVTSQRAVEEAEGELRVAEAELEAARTRLRAFGVDPERPPASEAGRVVLSSPLAGTVVARAAHVGQWVEPADAVLEVVDLDELWLMGAVSERDLRHVRSGQKVEIAVRSLPDERFAGEVARVADRLDPAARTATLRVVLPNPGHRLRPGMFATARLSATAEGEREALVVPDAALQEIEGRSFVFVPEGERSFAVRWIEAGERDGGLVEVRDGLSAGERVVTRGGLLLRGQLLRSTLGEDE